MRCVLAKVLILTLLALGISRVPGAEPDSKPVKWNAVLKQAPAWYATDAGAAIGRTVLLYQHATGGWPKNRDMTKPPEENPPVGLGTLQDITQPTIDNNATTTQLVFLARLHAAHPEPAFESAVLRGLAYLFEAQYPNGGYPQFYPLRKGYYSHITYNDDAMVNVLEVLDDVAQGRSPFNWVPADVRVRAATSVAKGVECILATQIRVGDRLTVWCAQHDEVTLAAADARKYEHASFSGGESVGIVRFLMTLPEPDARIRRAVVSAVRWFQEVKITGTRIDHVPAPDLKSGFDLVAVPDPAAPPIWARFYEIPSNRPIFGGRDGKIHYCLDEVERERRGGYSWYVDSPRKLLEKEFPAWCTKWKVDAEVNP